MPMNAAESLLSAGEDRQIALECGEARAQSADGDRLGATPLILAPICTDRVVVLRVRFSRLTLPGRRE